MIKDVADLLDDYLLELEIRMDLYNLQQEEEN